MHSAIAGCEGKVFVNMKAIWNGFNAEFAEIAEKTLKHLCVLCELCVKNR